MLRGSTADIDTDLTIVTKGPDADDGTLPHAKALVEFAEAVCAREPAALCAARDVLSHTLGQEALVDAAAVCAHFDAITRVADATGVQLDSGLEAASAGIRDTLGINAFNTTVEPAD